ncbi:MAG: PIF1-like helicase family protein [Cypionkella sp.]|uniref:AAA family ATPase n=1 Tax=Cypionkella sp. TaxID=2811411 RepID=UPI0026056668|nr:AAA family ATPase [Cypionkella sp.]MDB5660708.1 PIF1-like helicase family protein [Cypionkella sp.]
MALVHSDKINTPILTVEQQSAFDGIINQTTPTCVIAGSAGTGKSQLIAALAAHFGDRAMFVSPTHKAAQELSKRGNLKVYQVAALLKNLAVKAMLFEKKVTHIIVDEASMIDRKTKILIEKYIAANAASQINVVFLGDPNQLPPVNTDIVEMQHDWFHSVKPDFILTKGFRQDSNTTIKVVMDAPIDPNRKTICVTNYMRNKINVASHEIKHGKTKAYTCRRRKQILQPHAGDTLICYNPPVGMMFRNNCEYVIKSISDDTEVDGTQCFKILFEESRKSIMVPKSVFQIKGKKKDDRDAKRDFEFAYALTAHAAQGSGYDNVIVYLERNAVMADDGETVEYKSAFDTAYMQRWLYTAITRGKKSVLVVDENDAIGDLGLSLNVSIRANFNAADVASPVVTAIGTSAALPSAAMSMRTEPASART